MTGIEVKDLCVRFGDHEPVLNHLSMSVQAGSIVALLGGSGSGKSTLLRAIARLQPVSSGSVELTGDHAKDPLDELSYVFQDPTLLPWRSAQANVRLALELNKRNRDSQSRRIELVNEALEAVGLPKASWQKYPSQLSGGMRMRVSLARAIVTDPAILLLDEPFGALDEVLRGRMNELMVDLWMRKKRTVLFVTHNIAEAINLSQRMAVLGGGSIRCWIDNPLPMPRTSEIRNSSKFAEMYSEVSSALSAAVEV